MPLDYLAGYGAGIQLHVEDLAAYLAGQERCDAGPRMNELFAAYQELAATVGYAWSRAASGRLVGTSPIGGLGRSAGS
jgi:hypothetical protein